MVLQPSVGGGGGRLWGPSRARLPAVVKLQLGFRGSTPVITLTAKRSPEHPLACSRETGPPSPPPTSSPTGENDLHAVRLEAHGPAWARTSLDPSAPVYPLVYRQRPDRTLHRVPDRTLSAWSNNEKERRAGKEMGRGRLAPPRLSPLPSAEGEKGGGGRGKEERGTSLHWTDTSLTPPASLPPPSQHPFNTGRRQVQPTVSW